MKAVSTLIAATLVVTVHAYAVPSMEPPGDAWSGADAASGVDAWSGLSSWSGPSAWSGASATAAPTATATLSQVGSKNNSIEMPPYSSMIAPLRDDLKRPGSGFQEPQYRQKAKCTMLTHKIKRWFEYCPFRKTNSNCVKWEKIDWRLIPMGANISNFNGYIKTTYEVPVIMKLQGEDYFYPTDVSHHCTDYYGPHGIPRPYKTWCEPGRWSNDCNHYND